MCFYKQFRENKYISIALQVMRAGVSAVILDVTIDLAKNVFKTKKILYIAMMFLAFICKYFLGISAVIIILTCLSIGIIDLIFTLFNKKEVN